MKWMGVVRSPRVALGLLLSLGACQPSDDASSDGALGEAGTLLPEAALPAVDAGGSDAGLDAGVQGDAAAAKDGAALSDATNSGDAAASDATADAGEPLDPKVPTRFLSETGLYSDVAQKVLASGVQPYEVRGELWADGATKKRFLYLPPGTKIDTTDPDAWVFPIGTKVWKEFTRDNVRVETRLIQKVAASGSDAWKYVAYAWNMAQTAAEAVPLGKKAALGTQHDIPTQTNCSDCHVGSPDFVLGVSAFGLPVDGAPVSLAGLTASLTKPIAASAVAIPGNAATQSALATLHANCAHCHRPGTFAFEKAELELRLKVGVTKLEDTPIYKSSVGVRVGQIFENVPFRITAGKPAESAVYTRMNSRAAMVGMPNVGTKVVDTDGTKLVYDWIRSLAP
jgi:hypothetical protein